MEEKLKEFCNEILIPALMSWCRKYITINDPIEQDVSFTVATSDIKVRENIAVSKFTLDIIILFKDKHSKKVSSDVFFTTSRVYTYPERKKVIKDIYISLFERLFDNGCYDFFAILFENLKHEGKQISDRDNKRATLEVS